MYSSGYTGDGTVFEIQHRHRLCQHAHDAGQFHRPPAMTRWRPDRRCRAATCSARHPGGWRSFGDGTVFEIANTATGYATTPTTLVTFNGTGTGADPHGDA